MGYISQQRPIEWQILKIQNDVGIPGAYLIYTINDITEPQQQNVLLIEKLFR